MKLTPWVKPYPSEFIREDSEAVHTGYTDRKGPRDCISLTVRGDR